MVHFSLFSVYNGFQSWELYFNLLYLVFIMVFKAGNCSSVSNTDVVFSGLLVHQLLSLFGRPFMCFI